MERTGCPTEWADTKQKAEFQRLAQPASEREDPLRTQPAFTSDPPVQVRRQVSSIAHIFLWGGLGR